MSRYEKHEWTQEMEDELVRLWPTTAINDVKVHMRKKFKRAFSSSSLEAKARRLGLTKNYTAPAWSQDELDLVKKLRPTNTLMEIQSILKRMLGSERSAIAIERKAARLGWTYQGLGNENFVAAPSEMDISQSQALSRICALKEEYKTPCEYRPIGIIPRDKIARKILCIADLHIPFDRDDLVYDIVHTHKDADILCLNKDGVAFASASQDTEFHFQSALSGPFIRGQALCPADLSFLKE